MLSTTTRCGCPGPASPNKTSFRRTAAQAASAPAREHAAQEVIPSTTRRLLARRVGETFKDVAYVAEVPLRQPNSLGDDEVLVRMTHVGINGGCETMRARGDHAFARLREAQHFPLGAEGAGVVLACGAAVTHLQPGQAVACNSATFSEHAVLASRQCYPVEAATAATAATALSGMFACAVMYGTAQVKQGTRVLITAAAGAAGSFALQFAHAAGAHVTATVGSDRKAELARALGANEVVHYRTCGDTAEALARACPEGFDVAMDGVGGAMQDAILVNLAPGGTVLLTGYISEYPHTQQGDYRGNRPGPPNADVFWGKHDVDLGDGKLLTGRTWPQDVQAIYKCKQKAFDMVRNGSVRPLVDERKFCGLQSIPDAVEYMLSGQALGKVVVSL